MMRTDPSSSRVRVAFVGSSSVEATSPLPAALAAELGLRDGEWIALGRRGARLADWTSAPWPAGLSADAIVVLLTGNDARPTSAAVAAVDGALRARAPMVIWLPPLPYPAGSSAAGRDQRMRDALAAARVAQVTSAVQIEVSRWARDRVHLTRAGYQAYARQVAPSLRAALGASPPALVVASPQAPVGLAAAAPTSHARSNTPAPQPAPSSLLGTVITARGARLPLTSLDALWMARALAGEGGGETDAYAITSTMIRRWATLWDGGTRSFRSLTDLVVGRFEGASPYDGDTGTVALRGYSQPVAVQWRTESGARADRRRRIRSLAWDAIEPWRRQAVLRLFTGRAPFTANGAVHFAERSVVERRLPANADWRVLTLRGAANVFVSVLASRGRREPHVLGADQMTAPRPLEALGSLAARAVRRSTSAPIPLLVAGTIATVAAIALLSRPSASAPAEAAA